MITARRVIIFIVILILIISNSNLQVTAAFADTSVEMTTISGDFEQKKTDAINWADIVNTAFGAFLGFGFSLLLEAQVTKENKKKSINNIIAELSQIYDGIEQIILSSYNEELSAIFDKGNHNISDNEKEKLYIFDGKVRSMAHVIYLPIWDTLIQTGYLLEFKDEKYFEGLIKIYTLMIRLQKLIDLYHDDAESIKIPVLQEVVNVAETLKQSWKAKNGPIADLRDSCLMTH